MTTTKNKIPKWLLLVSLLAVFAVFAASCGDDDETSSETTTTTTAAPDPERRLIPNRHPSRP